MQSYFRQAAPMGVPKSEDEKPLLWDASKILSDAFGDHEVRLPRIVETIQSLQTILESTRLAYNLAIQERDAKRQQLVAAEGRLAEVQKVVHRYAMVTEPVVASDGYTYERSIIKQYLDECEAADNQAYSQQTKEVLTDQLIPNQSLKKLVDLLKTVKPLDVPQATQRSPIPPLRGGTSAVNPNAANANVSWGEEEDEEAANARKEEKAIHASDLEAAVTKRSTKEESDNGETAPSRPAPQRNAASANSGKNRSHPCLRVYGFCNFKDDCSFAKYPYEACLNNIKGKCRFGNSCKELHVNPQDPKFQNQRTQGNGSPPAPRSQRPDKKE